MCVCERERESVCVYVYEARLCARAARTDVETNDNTFGFHALFRNNYIYMYMYMYMYTYVIDIYNGNDNDNHNEDTFAPLASMPPFFHTAR